MQGKKGLKDGINLIKIMLSACGRLCRWVIYLTLNPLPIYVLLEKFS